MISPVNLVSLRDGVVLYNKHELGSLKKRPQKFTKGIVWAFAININVLRGAGALFRGRPITAVS